MRRRAGGLAWAALLFAACRAAGGPVVAGGAGGPVILGTLDRALVEGVIREDLAGLRRCYRRGLRGDPGLAGEITARMMILGDGRVVSVNIAAGSLGDPAVEACVLGRLGRLVFPTSKGGEAIMVYYPLSFSPG